MKHQHLSLTLLAIGACLFYGCGAFVAFPLIGGLYTGVTAPKTYDSGPTGQPYQILGVVEGKSTATSILGIVATGDASVHKAYQNALRQIPGAEALIEVTVDYQGTSVLGLFASYTTIVRGKAIKRMQ
ncbi:MAG: TRL domain-containing protein [Candidatus Nitrosotenuis sp.]